MKVTGGEYSGNDKFGMICMNHLRMTTVYILFLLSTTTTVSD